MAKSKSGLPETRTGLLRHLRAMKNVVTGQISAWNVPAYVNETVEGDDGVAVEQRRLRTEEEHPEFHAFNWEQLQRQAAALKAKADGLYIFAVQQGKLARERAHPANRPATTPDGNGDESE